MNIHCKEKWIQKITHSKLVTQIKSGSDHIIVAISLKNAR